MTAPLGGGGVTMHQADLPRASWADFTLIDAVQKGMSGDEKYRVTGPEGQCFLLRLSSREQYARKLAEFRMLALAYEKGVSVSRPVAFGIFQGGRVYQLTEWCKGTDLEGLLPQLSAQKAEALGRASAQVLWAMHQISAPQDARPWGGRFRQKIELRLGDLGEKRHMLPETALLAAYLEKNQRLADGCPQCFAHGDFNPGNLILLENGSLAVVDFNAYNSGYGEPLFELCPILQDDRLPRPYKEGFLRGYFPAGLPANKQALMLLYEVYGAIAALCEGEEAEEERMVQHICKLAAELARRES